MEQSHPAGYVAEPCPSTGSGGGSPGAGPRGRSRRWPWGATSAPQSGNVMTEAERYALVGIGMGSVVLGMKALAWWVTGSAALYSDALESIVNVAASLVALGALHFAARPADANHPYGHDKVEFFAAVIEGVMIVIAAGAIFFA